ncbi:hypothetical protein T492DRAFT_887135 [Pavlovales sp. CCMP2436]|nr:hypothetical protein T492DRAFT_887135 [Pavlovales sp. CCMP2436]
MRLPFTKALSSPLAGEEQPSSDGDPPLRRSPPSCTPRQRVACGGCCVVVLMIIAWLAFVAANFVKLASCARFSVEQVNTTALCEPTVHVYAEVRSFIPSAFGLSLGDIDADVSVRPASGHHRKPGPAEPAAKVSIPPFFLLPGEHALTLNFSLSIIGADALGRWLNASANSVPESEMLVAVRGSLRTSALFGIPLSIPFHTTQKVPSAPQQKQEQPPRQPKPTDPAAEKRAHEHMMAKRMHKCGSSEDRVEFPLQVDNTSHKFKVVMASKERLHIQGAFSMLVASPLHTIFLPNLSSELCIRENHTGHLASIVQVSSRAASFIQGAAHGPSDAIVDVLMASAPGDGERQDRLVWEATSRIMEDNFPQLFLRGSMDEEVLARYQQSDKPAGYNTASGDCPLQRSLQGVMVQVAEGLFESRPQLKMLMQFVACQWQQLHKHGGGDALLPPWGSVADCVLALMPGKLPLPGGIPDLPFGLLPGAAGAAPSSHGRSRDQASAAPAAGLPGVPSAWFFGAAGAAPSSHGRSRDPASTTAPSESASGRPLLQFLGFG